ncbi:hypothetical protein [Bacillus sp. JJ722]|uniref:hypothetical protein n=1 Tax=Bacillus sp. JJ722 TaxID=3122973 RepID=UPI002FFD6872
MKKILKMGCLGFIGFIVIIVIIAVATGSEDNTSTTAPKEQKNSSSKPAAKENTLTEEKFVQIKDGMSYEEVVAIVGSEGELLSETGEKGTPYFTQMYSFETDGFLSNSTMMFQNNKLINKAQFGLGEDSGIEIELAKFQQIQTGMTLEEVTKIVGGEGEITSETGEQGTSLHTIVYSYQGKGDIGANAVLMFQGNKLINKSQYGLK